ncbi:hypothetical protein Dimus_025752 [Dionaea muscipula]
MMVEREIQASVCEVRDDAVAGSGVDVAVMVLRLDVQIRRRVIEIEQRVHVRVEEISGELGAARVGDEPGVGSIIVAAGLVVAVAVGVFVVGVVFLGGGGGGRGGLGEGVGGGEERDDGEALVAASERVGGVDVVVAGDAEGGGVSLAGDSGGSLLADLAHPDSVVAGGELVGGVDLGVAGAAEEGGIGTAEEEGRRSVAGIAGFSRQPPP